MKRQLRNDSASPARFRVDKNGSNNHADDRAGSPLLAPRCGPPLTIQPSLGSPRWCSARPPRSAPPLQGDAGNDGGHEKLEMATRARAACRNSSRRRTRQETMASIVCAGHNLHARFGSHWLVRSQQ